MRPPSTDLCLQISDNACSDLILNEIGYSHPCKLGCTFLLVIISGLPLFAVGWTLRNTVGWWHMAAVFVAPLLYAVIFVTTAGLLSTPFQKAIVRGNFLVIFGILFIAGVGFTEPAGQRSTTSNDLLSLSYFALAEMAHIQALRL